MVVLYLVRLLATYIIELTVKIIMKMSRHISARENVRTFGSTFIIALPYCAIAVRLSFALAKRYKINRYIAIGAMSPIRELKMNLILSSDALRLMPNIRGKHHIIGA